jgi:hypothetical protein
MFTCRGDKSPPDLHSALLLLDGTGYALLEIRAGVRVSLEEVECVHRNCCVLAFFFLENFFAASLKAKLLPTQIYFNSGCPGIGSAHCSRHETPIHARVWFV